MTINPTLIAGLVVAASKSPPSPLGNACKLLAGIVMCGVFLFICFWLGVFTAIVFDVHPLKMMFLYFLGIIGALGWMNGHRPW